LLKPKSHRIQPLAPWLTLLALLTAPLAAEPARESENPLAGWTLEHESLEKALAGEKQMRLVNEFGSIFARTGDENVEISTVAQRHEGDPYRLLLESRSEGGVLIVEVKLRLEEGKTDDGGKLEAQKRRLDLTLFLPAGIALDALAEDSIETKKLHSDVDLVARKGHIFLDVFGRPRAKAFDQEIRGVLRETLWSAPGEIETRSGDIHLTFLDDADVEIEATSMGLITTDYSLDIERAPGHRHKKAHAKLGKGTAKLTLRSEAGQILILLNV
jgi:hypothetical protein